MWVKGYTSFEGDYKPLLYGEVSGKLYKTKNLRVPKREFWFWEYDPQMRGHRPQRLGVLCRNPKGALNSERTASISLAVTEKIDFEC